MNRPLSDIDQAMMTHKSVLGEFWLEAVIVVAYIRNRATCRGLSSITSPFPVWPGANPDFTHVRVVDLTTGTIIVRKQKELGNFGAPATLLVYLWNQEAYKNLRSYISKSCSLMTCKVR